MTNEQVGYPAREKVTFINIGASPEKKQEIIRGLISFTDITNLKAMSTSPTQALNKTLSVLISICPVLKEKMLSPQEQTALNLAIGYLKGFFCFHQNFLKVKPDYGITREEFWERVEKEAIPTFRQSLTRLTSIECHEGRIFC